MVRYRISGIVDLVPESQDACITDTDPGMQWHKSLSDSKLVQDGVGGFRWSPVRKPTTLHTYHNSVDFSPGSVVTYKFKWRSDGTDGSNREMDGARRDWSKQGGGISDEYLRCLAGTGDFRIGFFEAGDFVGDDSVEGPDVSNPAVKFNGYKGFQVRWHPHISKSFENLPGRLKEKKRDGDEESHTNMTLWTRIEAGRYGLMSDEAQRHEHSGFSKSDGWGTQPVAWGADAPFGEWVDVEVRMERVTDELYSVTFSSGSRTAPVLLGKFKGDFRPGRLDCMAFTYTNQSRKYDYVELRDLRVY